MSLGRTNVTVSLGRFLVPAARDLPSSSDYLRHLHRARNAGVIRLASNENTEPPSPRVRAALLAAYGDANLSPAPTSTLRTALAQRHDVPESQVLVAAGSTELIDAAFRTFVRSGDEVVLPTPSWPVFTQRLQALEAAISPVPLDADRTAWHYNADRLIEAVTPKTKLIVLCTPNNPTGNALSVADVVRIVELGVPVLLDAAYSNFDPDTDVTSLAAGYSHVIVTRTFSKAYCLAGLRAGYAVGSAEILDYVDRLLVPGSSISSAALLAALAALEDDAYHSRQVKRISDERDRLIPCFRELGYDVWDSRCNFVSVDCSGYPGGGEALVDALFARGVLVRAFGNIVRISIGTRRENEILLDAMALSQVLTA